MIPKQREMDGIVQEVYAALGSHGGSTPGETSPALVFISPKLRSIYNKQQSPLKTKDDFQYYSTIEQSDIAPTLAGLLGFPVPRNNLGVFIKDFLPFWPSSTGTKLKCRGSIADET